MRRCISKRRWPGDDGVTYDRDAAVEYARQFWNHVCSDGFICLDTSAVARCTGKPTGDPFVAAVKGTRFEVKAGSPPTESVVAPFGDVQLGAGCLDDATHFVSCCIGTPPRPSGAAGLAVTGTTTFAVASGGGLKLPSSPKFPKAPYGVTDATQLAGVLEAAPGVRPLAKKSSDRHLPAAVRNGDVIVYSRNGRYTHAAIFANLPHIATHSVSRSPESTVVSSDWDYVADLDPAFRWSIYHFLTPPKQFAVDIGPFPAKVALEFDAGASLTLQNAVTIAAQAATVVAKAGGAKSADTLAAAVVNLTGAPAKPARAGFFGDETFFVGSVAKVYPLYASIELRSRVRHIVDKAIGDGMDTSKPHWERPIIQGVEDAWKVPVAKGFGGLTKFPEQFPKLTTILDFGDFAPGEHVRFRSGPATADEVDDVGEFGRPTARMAFEQWLDLMVRWSNDNAADLVIRALGYPYINGVLREVGVQSPTTFRTGPCFISGSYGGHDWVPGTDLGQLGLRGTKHYKSTTNFVGNSTQVAQLLTVVATHRAFGSDPAGQKDCDEMLQRMMKGPGINGTTSFIRDALEDIHPGMPPISSKIGIGDPPAGLPKPKGIHDCAVVERTADHGRKLRYVLVVLGGYDIEPDPYFTLVQALDATIT
jgi:hypothetical protein